MKYGFVIDQRKCIGCHACTTACKSEHEVPLGVFRTWVKTVEKGSYPNTRKHFLVQRCNHCENAPCVTICPTRALYKRSNGIVDFNKEACIGCKSCMEACPYEAIYLDPATHTAAKCNFCAHRVEVGLQPACVIVCPEQAIISGDLEDPTSQISKLVGRENVQARKPEKGTKPQLYYLGADQTALNPESTPQPVGYMWSEPNTRLHGRTEVPEPVTMPFRPLNFSELLVNPAPAEIRGESSFSTLPPPPGRTPIPLAQITVSTASTNGKAVADPHKSVAAGLLEGGTDAQVAYNITHEQPWGFLVALYLWTKAIAAGVILLATLALGFGLAADTTLFNMLAPVLGLVFTGLTTLLLVADLKHPERFHYILLRPNRKSWLVWGAYILIVYTAILALWLLGRLIGSSELENSLLWPGALFAGMSAVYSAFLFGQAKGRDFWQSPLLAPQLFIQAVIAGSGALLLSGAITGTNSKAAGLLMVALLVGVSSNALVVLGELFVPHLNSHVNSAANTLKSGKYSVSFWAGFGVIGGLVPIVLLAVGLASGNLIWLGAIAAAMSLVGLLVYENLWIKAGQSVPLS